MRRHKKKLVFLVVTAVAAFLLFWPGVAPELATPPNLYLSHSESFGTNTGGGNVVGIEPFMEPLDYASAARFQEKLAGYFDAAKRQGWFGADTVVLLPEHLGTWLIAANRKSRVYKADTLYSAMMPLIAASPFQFLKNYIIFDDQDIASASLFRVHAQTSADIQLAVYGALARTYGVTIVAGSSALMTAGIYDGTLTYGHGPIYNASFVFGPDGTPMEDAVRKSHPIPSEAGFTTKWRPDWQPTFPLGRHRLGVMICADSWFDDVGAVLAAEGADILLVPSFLDGAEWDQPWQGYLNDEPANDAWRADVGTITEGQAWQKYALPARAGAIGIRFGMNVFLKGNLWGLEGHGQALILENGTLHVGTAPESGAALYNLWLD